MTRSLTLESLRFGLDYTTAGSSCTVGCSKLDSVTVVYRVFYLPPSCYMWLFHWDGCSDWNYLASSCTRTF